MVKSNNNLLQNKTPKTTHNFWCQKIEKVFQFFDVLVSREKSRAETFCNESNNFNRFCDRNNFGLFYKVCVCQKEYLFS